MKKWCTFGAVREMADHWAKEAAGKRHKIRERVWGTLSKAGLIAGAVEGVAQIGGAVASYSKHGFRKTMESIQSKYTVHPSNEEMLTRIDANTVKLLDYHARMEKRLEWLVRQSGGGGDPSKGGGGVPVKVSGSDAEEKKTGESEGNGDAKKPINGENGSNGASDDVPPISLDGETFLV